MEKYEFYSKEEANEAYEKDFRTKDIKLKAKNDIAMRKAIDKKLDDIAQKAKTSFSCYNISEKLKALCFDFESQNISWKSAGEVIFKSTKDEFGDTSYLIYVYESRNKEIILQFDNLYEDFIFEVGACWNDKNNNYTKSHILEVLILVSGLQSNSKYEKKVKNLFSVYKKIFRRKTIEPVNTDNRFKEGNAYAFMPSK